MLSILIPTYNYNVYPLVCELKKQADKLKIVYEILVQDDASNSELNLLNKKVNSLQFCKFSSNKVNLGRGKNINALSKNAIYDWLLILDCDMFPSASNFIENYIIVTQKTYCEAAYGGIIYQEYRPDPKNLLRWVYGKKRESLPLQVREKNPYFSSLTSNFLIKKSHFSNNLFPEEIIDYGYEDLVWIKQIKNAFIPITHIENPTFHLNLETSLVFIEKIKESLNNLKKISNLNLIDSSDSKIIKAYESISKIGLNYPVHFFFKVFDKRIEKNLLSKNPSLTLLDIYKLGYYCKINS